MSIYFISDLHLSVQRPKMLEQFVLFTEYLMHNADHLYILGDFFDAWLGDDLNNHVTQTVISQLKLLKESGVNISLMHGNRDFLIGKRFCERAQVNLINDPCMIHPFGISTVLLHGDSLCTQDTNYQRFRKIVRNKLLQKLVLNLPLRFRKNLAKKIRQQSKQNKQNLDLQIMDVTTNAVNDLFINSCANIMIHGHTHKLNVHKHSVQQQTRTRIVLGDWHDDEANTLYVCKNEWKLVRFYFNKQKSFIVKDCISIDYTNSA